MDDFAEFFSARRDVVFRAVLVAVGDAPTAEDAVAEAFTRAYERWRVVRTHANPTAWVMRTALNVARSWWRRRRREWLTPSHDTVAHSLVPPPADPLDAVLGRALASLPVRQRAVVALRVLADLSAEETGQILGIAPATVHVHLHRALTTVRAAVTPLIDSQPTDLRNDHVDR
jgi:RNA polymerase sigma factor (sigma-70 family)